MVVEAVTRELETLGALDSALGQSALALAADIDAAGTSATARAMAARGLRELLDRIRELNPVEVEASSLDELSSKRAKRLERQPAA